MMGRLSPQTMSELEPKRISVETAAEAEKRAKEESEAEKKAEIADALRFRKDKEKLLSRLEKDKGLAFLKSMVERGLIEVATAESIVSGEDLDSAEIEEIFSKIDEIENTHEIDRILPPEFRVSRDEYLLALKDAETRSATLGKLDLALDYIYQTVHPAPLSVLNFFGGFIAALDRNLVLVQENTIDIKRSLVSRT